MGSTVIPTALLSYGLSGKVFHAPFLTANPGFMLSGAWERSKNLFSVDFPQATTYRSLDEVLNDQSVALVIVNTPTHSHFEFASKALEAGKHVVVEKAFTTTVSEAVILSNLAKRHKKVLAVFQNRRWDSDFLAVQQVVRQGMVGEVTEAQIAYERYNLQLSPKQHREVPGPGAGNLMDLGPHLIDQALVLFGFPSMITCDLRALRPGSRVDDYFEIVFEYARSRVRLVSTYLAEHAGPAFIIQGTQGLFTKFRCDVQEAQLRAGISPRDSSFGAEKTADAGILVKDGVEQKVISPRGNYGVFYDELYSAICEEGPGPVTAEDGIAVMKVLEAARESARTGLAVRL